jgi:hypothetical protein
MPVAIAFFVALVVMALLGLVIGLTAFLAIPIGVVLFVALLALGAGSALLGGSEKAREAAAGEPGPSVPSTRDASYEPVIAPEDVRS